MPLVTKVPNFPEEEGTPAVFREDVVIIVVLIEIWRGSICWLIVCLNVDVGESFDGVLGLFDFTVEVLLFLMKKRWKKVLRWRGKNK